jgi:hydrophobe/amphiphile efflux-3 (HAE3) family protein
MQRVWSWLGLNLGKHAGIVAVVGVLVTLVFGFGITKLEFATGQDSYLNKDDEVYKDSVAYQELFGGQAMLSLVTMDEGHSVVELFTDGNLATWEQVEADLAAGGDLVFGVVSPRTALEFTHNLVDSPSGNPAESVAGQILLGATERDPSPEGQAARGESSVATLTRLNEIPAEERVLDNPAYVDFLLHDNEGEIRKSLRPFFPDERHAQLVVRLPGNQSIEDEGLAADFVTETTADLTFEAATVTTTGAPVLLKDINDYLTSGMMTLGAIAVGIMVLILVLLFGVRWRLLPLGVILIGVVWAFGAAGYLGIPLTIVTIAGLPVMLGVGIDYAIQMHARVEEEVIVGRTDNPIQETSRKLGPALLVVTFDAVFAFAALRFAQVPMIRAFGLLLAVGIVMICVCSIIVPLAVLGIREYRSPTPRREFKEGALGRLVVWLGNLPAKVAPPLAIISVLVFFGGVLVEDDLVLQTDPVEWVNQSSQVIEDLDTIEDEVGSSSELGMFVQSDDIFDDTTVGFVHDFAYEQLEANPDVLLTASSVVTTVSFLMEIPGATIIPPTGAEVEAAYEVAPPDIQLFTANEDQESLNLIFRTGPYSLDERAVVVNEIRDTIDPPPGVSATPSGLAVVGVGLLENLEANRVMLTYLAILFVFLFLAVRLRSLVRALLSLVPVLIAVGMASLIAWGFSLELSPMTAVGGPLVVAACTEFTSLILLRFIEERQRGLEPKEAVDVVASRTGRAFIVSALTAIAGVAVIATSSLPLLRDFGIIVAMNVTVALLSALVFLPPMLVWADQRGWVTRGMLKTKEPAPAT